MTGRGRVQIVVGPGVLRKGEPVIRGHHTFAWNSWPHRLAARMQRMGHRKIAVQAAGKRCAVCGTRLLADDPLGLLDERLAHAECVLIRWLDDDDHGDDAGGDLECPIRAWAQLAPCYDAGGHQRAARRRQRHASDRALDG